MELENTLGLSGMALMLEEERISKKKAKLLYGGLLDEMAPGTWESLSRIHRILFEDIYPFAGKLRTLNLAKGGFRFASALYLEDAVRTVCRMPHSTLEEIISKYVEMNIAHPFLEGNGRATRIWLDGMLKASLGQAVNWQQISREDYLLAMERSPVRDTELRLLLQNALTDKVEDQSLYMHSIDASYGYEGYTAYKAKDL